ncbi:MAG: FAD-binding oxidoreductase, partial [Candidatus Latescibacterota bacterium]
MVLLILLLITFIVLAFAKRAHAEDVEFFDRSEGEQFAHKWGYTDTRFEFVNDRTVRVTGNRYPICGFDMPYFVPFVEEVLQIPIRQEDMGKEVKHENLPQPLSHEGFISAIKNVLNEDQVSQVDLDRLVHSHGQLSVDEIYRVLYDRPPERLVDVVLYPEREEDVQTIIQLANEHNVVLVPYGGGTNVSGALAIPTSETRFVVSVDMRRMKAIVWLDEENFQACVEA